MLEIGRPVSAIGLGMSAGLVLATRDGFGLVSPGSGYIGTVVAVRKRRHGTG